MITDREHLRPVDVGLVVALTLERLYPKEFALPKLKNLLQDTGTISAIQAGKALPEIEGNWAADLEAFRKRRAQFLLY